MIRVLFVDDSALIRAMLKQVFREDKRFEVAGEAPNGKEAVDKARAGNIDLIVMDINMPIMDGIEATKQISTFSNAAIVMFTTEDTMDLTYRSISAGALEVLQKPNVADMTEEMLSDFREKIYAISQSRKSKVRGLLALGRAAEKKAGIKELTPEETGRIPKQNYAMLFIGSSTGGPSAIQAVLKDLGHDFPLPILITQHIDRLFDKQLVKWLDDTTSFKVTLAEDGETPRAGHVYVAPADRHLVLCKSGTSYIIELNEDPPIHFLRPSVDKMFSSAAKTLGKKVLAVILTGMGRDGADGAIEIRRAGGSMLAQDEESCTVFGMPKAVIEAGAAQSVIPLNQIGQALRAAVSKA
ncbi:MAG: chemotaxis-specific protein-glutamate methyltransferase CheB [Treponema sp.]|nr:chemotaxis-specific protein-glutamate methyltransferase CheB [Treponema sp.]